MRAPVPVRAAAVALLAILPYLGAIRHPLLHDDRTLLASAWVQREVGFGSALTHDYWHGTGHEGSDLYRPLTVLSLAWNLRAAPSAAGMRAGNLLLHAVVAVLLYLLLRALPRRFDPGGGTERASKGRTGAEAAVRGGGASGEAAAWFGAALFAVHPLASEAVLFAVGRAEMLAAALGLAAALCLLRAEASPRFSPYVVLGAACLGLALLAKESAAAWLVLGAAGWALAPRPSAVQRRSPLDSRTGSRRAWVVGACVLAVLGGYLVLRAAAVGPGVRTPPWVDNPLVRVDVATRAANAVLLFGRYVARMAFPARLSLEHGFDQVPVVPLLPWGLAASLALGAVWAAGIALLVRRSRTAALLAASIPGAFAVTGNLVLPIGTIFAERLAYLPLAAACGLVGWGLSRIRAPWLRVALVVGLVAAGLARSAVRARDMRSLVALQEATVRDSPRSVKALGNLARTRLRVDRDPRGALELLGRAEALWPGNPVVLDHAADAWAALGDEPRAAAYRERAARARGPR